MKNNSELSVPRAIKSQKVKERIYQAAIQLLQNYGYEYITVGNICKVAEVSTGSFYHYFESKDTLMANFFMEAYKDFTEKHKKNYEDPIEDIIQFFCSYSDFCQEQGLDFIRNFYTPFNRSMDMRRNITPEGSFFLPSMSETANKIQKGIEKGIFLEETDAQQVADDLCTIEKGCIFEWCVSDGSFSIRKMCERLLGNYLKSYLRK